MKEETPEGGQASGEPVSSVPMVVDLDESAKNSILALMITCPLMLSDYRLQTDQLVTASNACSTGGATARSLRIHREGKDILRSQLETKVTDGEDIMLIECFGGLGSLRQGFVLNHLHPGIHVLIETNSDRVRATQMQWTGLHHWGDISRVDEAKLRTLVPLASRIRLILIGGTFPPPDEQAHSSRRRGGDPARPYTHIKRLALLCRDIFRCQVKRFYESEDTLDDRDAYWM